MSPDPNRGGGHGGDRTSAGNVCEDHVDCKACRFGRSGRLPNSGGSLDQAHEAAARRLTIRLGRRFNMRSRPLQQNSFRGPEPMAGTPLPVLPRRFGATMRRDAWWVQPAIVFLVLSAFIVLRDLGGISGTHYTYGPYLSPFYSPELFGDSPHAWFGPKPGWWPALARVLAGAADPAVSGAVPVHLLLLPRRLLQGVLGRSAIVRRRRAAETVPAARRSFPLIVQNIHRYFLYIALLFLVFLVCTTSGRRSGSPIPRPGRRVRHRRRHAGARDQCRPARRLHARLSLVCATSSAAFSTGCRGHPVRRRRLRLLELLQPRAHAVGVVSLVLRRVRRPLRPALLDGHLERLADPVRTAIGHRLSAIGHFDG